MGKRAVTPGFLDCHGLLLGQRGVSAGGVDDNGPAALQGTEPTVPIDCRSGRLPAMLSIPVGNMTSSAKWIRTSFGSVDSSN